MQMEMITRSGLVRLAANTKMEKCYVASRYVSVDGSHVMYVVSPRI